MHDLPREKLTELLQRYGTTLCHNAKRLESLLRDACAGEYQREIFVLTHALKQGIAREVFHPKLDTPSQILTTRLAQRLHDNLGFDKNLALWAVQSWLTVSNSFPPHQRFIPERPKHLPVLFQSLQSHPTPTSTQLPEESLTTQFMTLPDNSRYQGELHDGKPHGNGIQIYPDGYQYEGMFYQGQRQGNGKEDTQTGEHYEGEFYANQRHGKGMLTLANGDSYSGEFTHGHFNESTGTAVLHFLDGKCYEGETREHQPHGQGKLSYPNGESYEGEFWEGAYHGWGVLHQHNGNYYEGEFRDNKRHGYGTLIYANGSRYQGHFRHGNYNGQGTLQFANGSQYDGNFKDGKFNGYGVFISINGKQQKGIWQNNQLLESKLDETIALKNKVSKFSDGTEKI
ncbi:hypothetical protein BegalDRAFT_3471 [Beggiatoa alba B18LD]|uniref:MORN repeat protein n=1 Tax=Beggiatoa alba B18LD TaxID=395493 RepID=I3CKZ2_9GAMM|nr:hypothetical protein [Beggiatoa alba]EIJ44285.1 hypothetical protein BegalDRAFT_3471 [Beggiatoa alba B18LD]